MINAISNPLVSFKSLNFTLFFFGSMFISSAAWIVTATLPLLVLNLTNDIELVGIIFAIYFLPSLIFTLFSGVIIDALGREKIVLYFTQSATFLTLSSIWLCLFFGYMTFGLLLFFVVIQGLINSIDYPARHSFVRVLIKDKAHLSNAVSLMAVTTSLSRIIGPSIAALIISSLGLNYCLVFAAVFCLPILLAFIFIKIPFHTEQKHLAKNFLKSINTAFSYAKRHDILLTCFLLFFIVSLFVPNYAVSISALVKMSFGAGDEDFAYVMSFLGIGALIGTSLNTLRKHRTSMCLIFLVGFCSIICIGASAFTNSIFMLGLCLAGTGFFFVIFTNLVITCIQTHGPMKLRGRMMGIYTLIYFSTAPVGMYLSGELASALGARMALLTSSGLCFAAVTMLLIYKIFIRKFYQKC